MCGASPQIIGKGRDHCLYNITVVLGVTEMDPEKAVVAHANHTLQNGANVCEHGDTVCDHGH
jgi:hypothetical protein